MTKTASVLLFASIASASAFADSFSNDFSFSDTVDRVCGIEILNNEGTIVFNGEDESNNTPVTFKVYDNGTETTGNYAGQTEISITTTDLADSLTQMGISADDTEYGVSGLTRARRSGQVFYARTRTTQTVYGIINVDAKDVQAGEVDMTATITVHCGK